jgi:2-oxoisovalerate dehydrogenase E1 component alpha subunit
MGESAYVESESDDEFQSPSFLMYTEGRAMPIVSRLHIVTPDEDTPRGTWPVFRLMVRRSSNPRLGEAGSTRDRFFPYSLTRASSFSSQDENGTFREADDAAEAAVRADARGGVPTNQNPKRDDLEGLRAFLCQSHPHHANEFAESGLLQPAKFEYADVPTRNTLYRALRQMIRLKEMDHILLNAQRQGRISFYMTCRGEEAIHMGSASALDLQDPVFAQYREQGILMWRGFTLEQFTNQCFSNDQDLGKGRQMPVHYGSRALNYQTVSSPLGTQLPQAVGAAYRLKLAGRPNVAVCYFGDGCASTTDFHSALNFAATLEAPVLFVCRNNGYAISTPTRDQYRGDGIVCRAPGYGMAAIRVDGNDVFAVHAAVREARRYALERSAPVLVEAMTYRLGHHSTSDDSTRYRNVAQVADVANRHDPIARLGQFLERYDWLGQEEEASMHDEERVAVLKAIEQAERRPPPPLDALFEDVYHDMPRSLAEQQTQLREHVAKYPKMYSTNPHHH